MYFLVELFPLLLNLQATHLLEDLMKSTRLALQKCTRDKTQHADFSLQPPALLSSSPAASTFHLVGRSLLDT